MDSLVEMEEHGESSIDAHGHVDILTEEEIWQNMKLQQHRRHWSIEGVSLNALLLGQFTLYGARKDDLQNLPGGINSWEATLEPFFISIRQIATVDCIMRRVRALARRYHHRCYSSGSIDGTNFNSSSSFDIAATADIIPFRSMCGLLNGAISYCNYWCYCFRAFLSDHDLIRIKIGALSLQQFISPPISALLPGTALFNECTSVFSKYQELLATASEVLNDRLQGSLGINIDPQRNHLFTCNAANVNELLTAAVNAVHTSSSGSGSIGCSSSLHVAALEVDVPIQAGSWTGHEVVKQRQQLKAALSQGPKIKLEIFGADSLLDELDDDSDDDNNNFNSNNNNNSNSSSNYYGNSNSSNNSYSNNNSDVLSEPQLPPVITAVPRIPAGSSLLLNPLAVGNSLLDIDATELARQWTLADHAFFCSIPLHSLVPQMATLGNYSSNNSGSNSNNGTSYNNSGSSGDRGTWDHGIRKLKACYEMPRHVQLRRGVQSCGPRGGARGFIDRFNALSNWVTFSILTATATGTSTATSGAAARAARIAVFIRIAGQLMELCNYNGLMVILTALQQGSISRLIRTWEEVAKAEKLKLAQMQKLMAASKNYQFYRQELARLSIHFELADINSNNSNSSSSNSSRNKRASIYHRSDMMWKTRIHLRSDDDDSNNNSNITSNNNNSNNNNRRPSSTFTSEDKFEAVVPHMGAHLSELASLQEGNSDFLSDRSYLYNVHKFVLIKNTMGTLQKMQRLQYRRLLPVRLIIAALNNTAKVHLRLSSAEASAYSKQLFAMSEAIEPTSAAANSSTAVAATTSTAKESVDGDAAVGFSSGISFDTNTATAVSTAVFDASKRPRSAAYDRILQSNATSRRDSNASITATTTAATTRSDTNSKSSSSISPRKPIATATANNNNNNNSSSTTATTVAARRRMKALDVDTSSAAAAAAEEEGEEEGDDSKSSSSDDESSDNSSSSSSSSSEVKQKKGIFSRSAKLVRKFTSSLGFGNRSKSRNHLDDDGNSDADDDG